MGVESWIEGANVRYARRCGMMLEKFVSPGTRGVPDRILCGNAQVAFIEYKAPGQQPEGHQRRDHARRREAGLVVYVVDDKVEGERIILHHSRNPPGVPCPGYTVTGEKL